MHEVEAVAHRLAAWTKGRDAPAARLGARTAACATARIPARGLARLAAACGGKDADPHYQQHAHDETDNPAADRAKFGELGEHQLCEALASDRHARAVGRQGAHRASSVGSAARYSTESRVRS